MDEVDGLLLTHDCSRGRRDGRWASTSAGVEGRAVVCLGPPVEPGSSSAVGACRVRLPSGGSHSMSCHGILLLCGSVHIRTMGSV